jgi:hypothetical protein
MAELVQVFTNAKALTLLLSWFFFMAVRCFIAARPLCHASQHFPKVFVSLWQNWVTQPSAVPRG